MLIEPSFPPLFTGHRLLQSDDVLSVATQAAVGGKAGAGDVFWMDRPDIAQAAFVLEPDVPLQQALQMWPTLMVAVGDAIGTIGPPKMPFTYRWPGVFVANGGEVGEAYAVIAEGLRADEAPDWLVVGFSLRMQLPEAEAAEPGENANRTALHMEGCGDLSSIDVIDASSRHFMAAIDTWLHDGFRSAHEHWSGRADKSNPLGSLPLLRGLKYVGLDEMGSALVRDMAGTTRAIGLTDVATRAARLETV